MRGSALPYALRYTPRTFVQIGKLSAYKKAGLFDRVKAQLFDNPRQQTNNRKLLRSHPLYAPTKEFWELRFGDIRVFYFTTEQTKKMVT